MCCKQARSVAFFEARLFLRGAYEAPCRLLERLSGEAAAAMARMDTWVVQGTGDAVCPEEFARELVAQMRAIRDALEPSQVGAKGAGLLSTHFVDAGHKAGAAGIKEKLIAAHRAGMRHVLIPAKNEKDLRELPQVVVRAAARVVAVDEHDVARDVGPVRRDEAGQRVAGVARVAAQARA